MWRDLVDYAVPILALAIVGAMVKVASKAINIFGEVGVAFLAAKKDAIVAKVGKDTYNDQLDKAHIAWDIVEEFFRIHPEIKKTIDSTAIEFTDQIKKLIPYITDEEIETLKQAVAGEVNKGKSIILKSVK